MMKLLLKHGLIDGSCLTVTGKTIAENLESVPDLAQGQQVIMPLEKPIKATGHLQVGTLVLFSHLTPPDSCPQVTRDCALCSKSKQHLLGPVTTCCLVSSQRDQWAAQACICPFAQNRRLHSKAAPDH